MHNILFVDYMGCKPKKNLKQKSNWMLSYLQFIEII